MNGRARDRGAEARRAGAAHGDHRRRGGGDSAKQEVDMTEVLAVLRPGTVDAEVPAAARTVAGLLRREVRELRLSAVPGRWSTRAAERAIRDPLVSLVVVGRGSDSSPMWSRIARQVGKPVVVVPSSPRRPDAPNCRVLVPLDGTPVAGRAVAEPLAGFAQGGVELMVVVVVTASTGPRCIDHLPWDYLAWQEQFLTTHCAHPGTRMILARGTPGPQITHLATRHDVGWIVVSRSRWSRPGGAATVDHIVRTADVPVLLVPTDERCENSGASGRPLLRASGG
jgi:hypothetical protein